MDIITPDITITEVMKVNDEIFYEGEIVEIKTLDLKTYKGKLDNFSMVRGICLDCSADFTSNCVSIPLKGIISIKRINKDKKPKKKLFKKFSK